MPFDRITLNRQAKEYGFVRDTFEKVCRLTDILQFMEQDALLATALALKGGTAINLTIFSLPRLSVDIDLDFVGALARDEMLCQRTAVTSRISKYMEAQGYALSPKSRNYHALDSFVYEYTNGSGIRDNLKIEINYMLRSHILPTMRRTLLLPWADTELTVLSVAPMEIFASKIVALLNRTAPRDLYDVHNMLRFGLFDESEQGLLRKCILFYSAVGSEEVPTAFRLDAITAIPQYRVKTDLVPVLRTGVFFDVKIAQKECGGYLSKLLVPTHNEKQFLDYFRCQDYRPALLFEDEAILKRIADHPMAAWKCNFQLANGIQKPLKNAGQAIRERKDIRTSSRKSSDIDI